MSRIKGVVKVAPVDPATKTRLSNCLKGLIEAYGPSIRTLLLDFLFDDEGKVGKTFSAYLKNRFVAPFLDRTRNSIFPSDGRLAMVKGWEVSGAMG
jgi:hypothetical protein